MRHGLYQGWLGHRNLGDEALYQACVRCIPRIRWLPLPFDEDERRRPDRRALRNAWLRRSALVPPRRVGLLGGGTLINQTPHWLQQYRLLHRATRRPVPVFSPGVADPAYWASVPGWRDTRAEWCAALASLPEVGVRGPLSKRLLEEAGLRNVIVAGDPALSFHRGARNEAPGRRRIAVNVGRTGGLMWGSEERALVEFGKAVGGLHRSGFEVRFFPMWHGDAAVCRDVARAAGLAEDVVDPLVLDAERFVGYLSEFDVVLSVKLHAAVLAAAAGVPFVAVEHQPKVRDFVESIGWSELTQRSDSCAAQQLERAVRAMYDDLPVFRDRLHARVEEMALTFRAYAERVQDHLLCA